MLKLLNIKTLTIPLLTLMLLPIQSNAATASYYGSQFNGKKTASGERFNMNAMTCASNSHKMGTRLKVTNKANNKSITCKVNDRGGFAKYGRTLDLSKGAFSKIASLKQGLVKVNIKVLK